MKLYLYLMLIFHTSKLILSFPSVHIQNYDILCMYAIRLENLSFHFNPKEEQCQRMSRLPHTCTHFIYQQGYAQNPSSQAPTVREPRTSRCKFQAGFRKGFLGSSAGKESACDAGDPSLIPGSGRSMEKGQATHSSILGLPWWLSW